MGLRALGVLFVTSFIMLERIDAHGLCGIGNSFAIAREDQVIDALLQAEPVAQFSSLLRERDRLVYFGRNLFDPFPATFFRDRMRQLKYAGVTHLALEGIQQRDQPAIDHYFRGNLSKQSLGDLFFGGAFPKASVSEVEILLAAKDVGVAILALGGREREAWETAFETLLMANPSAKIVALVSAEHAATSPSPSFLISGGPTAGRFSYVPSLWAQYLKTIRPSDGGRPFAIRTDRETELFDGFILNSVQRGTLVH